MTQRRAQVGGEVGINGEDYKGGQFIANTEKPKAQPRPKSTGRKVEVAPYVYEVAPAEMESPRSLFAFLGGSWMTRDNKPFIPFCAYNNVNPDNVQKLIDRYLAGEKWIEYSELLEILG